MDLDQEFRDVLTRIRYRIEVRSRWAIERLYQMHSLPIGICGCGADNHYPAEQWRDKSWGTGDGACLHESRILITSPLTLIVCWKCGFVERVGT